MKLTQWEQDALRDRVGDEEQDKANKMRRFADLGSVARFLDSLGNWPRSTAEWAAAYDLWRGDASKGVGR